MHTSVQTPPQVKTASGVSLIDPKIFGDWSNEAASLYFHEKVRQLLERCNTTLLSKVKEFQEAKGTKEVGSIVTVHTNSGETSNMLIQVVKELNEVGYKARYMENEDFVKFIEITI